MKLPLLIILNLFIIFTHIVVGQSANTITPFASGLNKPVCIANAGDNRLFVVSELGTINIVDTEGNVKTQSFLDIRDRVVYGGERGLLGLAFHPQYPANGYFYVNYIGNGDSTYISRFTVSAGNPDLANPASELKLLTIFQPYQNHNGGDLNFGPDGFLYIGLGDGGSGGDPENRAQNLLDFHGKILRIDVNHGNPYSIPESNPFYNSETALPEIWAYGLRNPWRFSFDRLTGDLWIGDVGQSNSEEIDFQLANSPGGDNYGWRCYEGDLAYNTSQCSPDASFTFPVYTYPHGPECSVTGGYVYRGSTSSPFYGYYFFSDYCSDRIWTLHNESGNWIKEDFGQFSGNNFSTFGEDVSGRLYVAGVTSGKIFRIKDFSTGIGQLNVADKIIINQLPNSSVVHIEKVQARQKEMIISVFDMKGTIVYQAKTVKSGFDVSLNEFPSGTYILNIKIDGNKISRKLVLGK